MPDMSDSRSMQVPPGTSSDAVVSLHAISSFIRPAEGSGSEHRVQSEYTSPIAASDRTSLQSSQPHLQELCPKAFAMWSHMTGRRAKRASSDLLPGRVLVDWKLIGRQTRVFCGFERTQRKFARRTGVNRVTFPLWSAER